LIVDRETPHDSAILKQRHLVDHLEGGATRSPVRQLSKIA